MRLLLPWGSKTYLCSYPSIPAPSPVHTSAVQYVVSSPPEDGFASESSTSRISTTTANTTSRNNYNQHLKHKDYLLQVAIDHAKSTAQTILVRSLRFQLEQRDVGACDVFPCPPLLTTEDDQRDISECMLEKDIYIYGSPPFQHRFQSPPLSQPSSPLFLSPQKCFLYVTVT